MTTHQAGHSGLLPALTEAGRGLDVTRGPGLVLTQTDTLVWLAVVRTGELRPG